MFISLSFKVLWTLGVLSLSFSYPLDDEERTYSYRVLRSTDNNFPFNNDGVESNGNFKAVEEDDTVRQTQTLFHLFHSASIPFVSNPSTTNTVGPPDLLEMGAQFLAPKVQFASSVARPFAKIGLAILAPILKKGNFIKQSFENSKSLEPLKQALAPLSSLTGNESLSFAGFEADIFSALADGRDFFLHSLKVGGKILLLKALAPKFLTLLFFTAPKVPLILLTAEKFFIIKKIMDNVNGSPSVDGNSNTTSDLYMAKLNESRVDPPISITNNIQIVFLKDVLSANEKIYVAAVPLKIIVTRDSPARNSSDLVPIFITSQGRAAIPITDTTSFLSSSMMTSTTTEKNTTMTSKKVTKVDQVMIESLHETSESQREKKISSSSAFEKVKEVSVGNVEIIEEDLKSFSDHPVSSSSSSSSPSFILEENDETMVKTFDLNSHRPMDEILTESIPNWKESFESMPNTESKPSDFSLHHLSPLNFVKDSSSLINSELQNLKSKIHDLSFDAVIGSSFSASKKPGEGLVFDGHLGGKILSNKGNEMLKESNQDFSSLKIEDVSLTTKTS